MEELRISEREKKVLEILSLDIVAYYSHITTWTGLNLSQARRATRSLARKGLAEHSIAWDDDEGTVRGSGYIKTKKGAQVMGEENA